MSKLSLNSRTYQKNKKLLKKDLCATSACPYCNAVMNKNEKQTFSSVTIDHVKSRAQGGGHEKENLVAVCGFCNMRKADKNNVLMFKMFNSRALSKQEYLDLNAYLEMYNRLESLKRVKALIAEDQMDEALALLDKSKEVGQKHKVFNNLISFIESTLSAVKSIMLQITTILDRVNMIIAQLSLHFSSVSKRVKNIGFTTYSLVA